MRQTSFAFTKHFKKEFGGSLLAGKRKSARPISVKHPLFMTLKSNHTSLFSPSNRVLEKLIRTYANKYKIKLHELSLNYNHIHFVISVPSKEMYLKFIRTLTSEIVRVLSKLTGKNLKGLFTLRPHTRIISWGREFKSVLNYIVINQMESWGLIYREKPIKKKKRILRLTASRC